MRNALAICGTVALGCALAGILWADDRNGGLQQQSSHGPLMLAKLSASQRIVGGLVSEDFAEIRRGAADLRQICEATAWKGHSDQIYAHHRTELRRQTEKLIKMAGEKNLDGAAFSYMQSLTTCISCHQYCRDVLHIADELPMPGRVVPIPVDIDAQLPSSGRPQRR